MKALHKTTFLLVGLLLCAIASCKVEKIEPVNESVKDISGSWALSKVTRNGTDITQTYDFSKFRVIFQAGNYTIENKLPFIVAENGSFNLDDDQFAFSITFKPAGGAAQTSPLSYPTVNGTRELGIQFSTTGCTQNKYTYTFRKVN